MTVYQKEYLLKGWHTQQGLVSSTTAGCSLEILRLGQLLSYEAGKTWRTTGIQSVLEG